MHQKVSIAAFVIKTFIQMQLITYNILKILNLIKDFFPFSQRNEKKTKKYMII